MPALSGEPADHWRRYLSWLHMQVPETFATLRTGAEPEAIAAVGAVLGRDLPPALTVGWSLHDGQPDTPDRGAILGYLWLPASGVLAECQKWAELRDRTRDETMRALRSSSRSHPPNAIKRAYTLPGWIPLFQRPLEGNYIGLDFDPGPAGQAGQVINFGRDEDDKVVLAPSLESLLEWILQEVQAGRYVARIVDDDEETNGLFEFRHADGDLIEVLKRTARARAPGA